MEKASSATHGFAGEAADTRKQDLSVSLVDANLYALAFVIPIAVVLTAAYTLAWGWTGISQGLNVLLAHWTIPPTLLLGGIVLHELIHGLSWCVFGRKLLSEVDFGVKWQYLTPYAHIRVPLRVGAYRWGALMPGLLLGIVPAVWGIVSGAGAPFLFGLLFSVAAGGDFLILWLLRRVPSRALVEDHPSRAGCYVIYRET